MGWIVGMAGLLGSCFGCLQSYLWGCHDWLGNWQGYLLGITVVLHHLEWRLSFAGPYNK
jgi:hypothetical protein